MQYIERRGAIKTSVTVDTVLADAAAIDISGFAGAAVRVPSGSSITSLTVYGATAADGTFAALHGLNSSLAAVALALTGLSAGKGYELPSAIFPWPFIKLVGDADGVVDVVLKT